MTNAQKAAQSKITRLFKSFDDNLQDLLEEDLGFVMRTRSSRVFRDHLSRARHEIGRSLWRLDRREAVGHMKQLIEAALALR